MKILRSLPLILALIVLSIGSAQAHFGMLIPSQANVMESKDSEVSLALKFWHPFENKGMHLEKPAVFQVYFDGKTESLLPILVEKKEQGFSTWFSKFSIKRPGLYTFVMEPQPYFEKDEDCFIVHITKTYVSAFGGDENWDQPLGLKAEIVPLSDPNALYGGNAFQGRVLHNAQPVPHATVEVEWYPGEGLKGDAPFENMITQTVKTDAHGVFTYVAPRTGWWGFAALLEDQQTLLHEGEEKSVELGAIVWVYFHDLLPAKNNID